MVENMRAQLTDTPRVEDQLCLAVHTAARALTGVYRRLLRDLDLTYPQYQVMLALWEYGELPVKQLGELLHLDSGTLSPLLKRLDTAGLVRRERSRADERSTVITPTARGCALQARAADVPVGLIEAAGLDLAEAGALRDKLRALAAALDASADV